MRRKYTRSLKCSEPTCEKYGFYEYDTRREYDAAVRANRIYTCSLHANKSRVLSLERLKVEWVSAPNRQESYGRFFGNSGLIIGESYYAAAEDFPVGARVKITAEVILPEATA